MTTPTRWEGRFRVAGTNWEGRPWSLVPSLVVLARQISNLHPTPKPGDGTVASKRHDEVSPGSDHRPRPTTGPGVVRAIDVGETVDADPMVAALVRSRDPRIAYVIYEGVSVWSVTRNGFPAWTPQPYLGPNPHAGHFHLSTRRTAAADNDTRLWTIDEEVDDMPSPKDWTENDWAAFAARVGPLVTNFSVGAFIGTGANRRRITQAINATEGIAAATLAAVRAHSLDDPFDEGEVARLVLEGLTAESIAAALPDGLAAEIAAALPESLAHVFVDVLHERLAPGGDLG